MTDLTNEISLDIQTAAKEIGVSKLISDLKELRSGMDVTEDSTASLVNQFKNLKVNLTNSKLKSTISSINSDILKYTTSTGQLVTVNRKVKGGLDNYTVSLKNMNNQLQKSNSLWSAFTKGISGMIVKTQIVWRTLKGLMFNLSDVVRTATEYEEAMNLFVVSMGEKAEEATAWIERFSTALYLDPSNVMQYMGSLNSLISGLGVGADKSYLMSKNLTQLAYDLASFKNMKFEEAFTKLQSGISGEIEPLRNVGVALSQATLQELANSLGIKERVAEMSEAEKAQLRYIQIIKSTSQWQGDMARTLVSPANAVRVLKEQFTLLGRAIGSVFLPIVMKVLPYVMALTQILTDLANKLASFFGYEFTDIDYSSLGSISSEIGNIGDEAESTTKKLNTMLAPFDELNVVQSKTQSASSGVGGLGGDLGLDLPEYDALAGLTDQFKNNIESAKSNLQSLFDILKKIGIVLGTIWAVNKLVTFGQFLGKLFGILPSGTTKFTGLASVIHTLAKRFKDGRNSTNSFLGGLKAMFPWLNKTKVGIAGVITSFLGSYDAAKKAADGTKNVDNQIKKFWATTAAAAGGGALMAGPLGALAGIIGSIGVSLIGLGTGYDKLQKELAEKEVFGTLTVSTQSFKDMLDTMNLSIPTSTQKLLELKDTIAITDTSFANSLNTVEQYMYRFGTLGQQISDEDAPKILAAFESMFADANTIIDNGTQYSLELWTNSMMGMSSITKEEQKNILDDITKNGEYQKNAINNAQKDIYTIWNTAMNERGKLTEEEYKKIQELLGIIQRYTENSVSAAQSKLLLMKNQFSDKNFQLDKKSYSNFIAAREEYESEQEKSAQEHYNTLINDAEKQYKISLDRLISQGYDEEKAIELAEEKKKKAYEKAYESYVDLQNNYKTESEKMTNDVFDTLRKKYSEIKDSNEKGAKDQKAIIENLFKDLKIDLNPIRNTYTEAGKEAGVAFSTTFEKYVKGKSVKYKMTTSANGEVSVQPYATGGFPKTGEFFMAREAGPEMVGRIGNQTAVANNDQITTSITNALITALNNYKFGGKSGTTVVNIGGRKVYEGVGDYVDSENDRYGTSYVHI